MLRSTRSSRVLAMSASGALVSTLALLPSGAASALTTPPVLILDANVSFSSSGPTCTQVGTPPNETTNFTNGSASNSVSLDTTVTNTDAVSPDPGDHSHVTGNLSATGTLKKHKGSMTSYKLSGTGKVSVKSAEGSASQCNVSADMTAETELSFTEAKSGWVLVTRSQAKNILTELVIEGPKGALLLDLFGGPKSSATDRVFVKPGQYTAVSAFIINSGPFIALKAGTPTTKLSGVFRAAGSALGGTSGAAHAYLKFPGSISCTHHSAKLTWTGKAGQVAAGSISVNGRKKATVSNPKSGHSVVLHHLSRTADLKIRANLSLNRGGHASASRRYLPCKG